MTEHDTLAERGRALEEEYFRRKDRELIAKMRRAAAAERARDRLEQQTGLDDPEVLQELQQLGFTPDTVTLLPLVPVVEMAWAEGGIMPAERHLIVKLARARGIREGSAADEQLTRWMTTRPEPAVFAHAGRLIAAMLASESAPATRGLSADDLVAYCERIASAAGGILNMGWISPDERALLERIASELKGGESRPGP